MKKIIIFLAFIYVFSFMSVKAELTSKQAEDLAFFAEKFITEGNKRISSNGFSLLAYGQVPGRSYGFSSQLYKISKDFKGIYKVNEEKWVFDCSSFVSYVYYHVFGLAFTLSELDTIDPYSHQKLMDPIMGENNTTYRVIQYVDNANDSKHFYYIYKNKSIKNYDYNLLKPGDLITIIGDSSNHIMLYLGNGMIAHASTSEINKPNLGLNVVLLKDSKYAKEIGSVIRLKSDIIDPNKEANLTLTWLDTNTFVDFNKLRYANDIPKISYVLSNSNWTNELEIVIELSDEDGISDYSFTDSLTSTFTKISGKKFNTTKKILKNGTYYITVKDVLNNSYTEKIAIDNIDLNMPVVNIDKQLDNDNTIIMVNANDLESGLFLTPYSYDGGISWSDSNIYEISKSGIYSIWVKDKAGNIYKESINVVIKDIIIPEIVDIKYGKMLGTKQEVTITGYDSGSGIKGYAIKNENNITELDSNWEYLAVDTYTVYLEKGTYYIFIIDNCNNISKYAIIDVNSKSIASSRSNVNIITIIIIILLILILVTAGYMIVKNKKKRNYNW